MAIRAISYTIVGNSPGAPPSLVAGATLKLVYVTGRVRQVFELAGKTDDFTIFDDERAAISTF